MPFVDFDKVKAASNAEACITMLNLAMTKKGSQWRGECSACRSGGNRALAVNSDRKFYCFAGKVGGDMIGLVAHIRGVGQNEAANILADHFRIDSTAPSHSSPAPTTPAQKGMEELDYLDPIHEMGEQLGIPPTAADALGAGYATRGTMRGRYLIPLRLADGTLIGYCGIAPDQDPPFLFPDNLEDRAEGKVVQLRRKKG